MIAEAPGETRVHHRIGDDDETPRAPVMMAGVDTSGARLSELLGLEANWDGYAARPLDSRALAVAANMIRWAAQNGFPAPEIFPVPSGGIQLEWRVGPMELEFEIEPGASSAVFVGDDRRSGRHFDGEFPRDAALWRQALVNLASHLGEPADG